MVHLSNYGEPTETNIADLAYYDRRDRDKEEVIVGFQETEIRIIRLAFMDLLQRWIERTGDVPEILSQPTNDLLSLIQGRLDRAESLFAPKVPEALNEEEVPAEVDPDPLVESIEDDEVAIAVEPEPDPAETPEEEIESRG